ncbi:ABC transporter ATP-binding protein [Gammaproteobacteria bacterium]|nr:ABC transporter ATP-binding protein [Gammaproteobacteria bacterium]
MLIDTPATGSTILSIQELSKRYAGGFEALKSVSLDIKAGEIIALLGPNGAGKTTLISTICGLVQPSAGRVLVAGHDITKDYRITRSLIGLVPQELTTDSFETVWNTVSFSRGLFGKAPNPAHIEKVLRSLSLWDKKDNMLRTLSGGMKRRVLIAKALSHEPRVLFLDEPTAGVDVALRKDMWAIVNELRASGVTIILTTHYIEEAEEIADRIGVINHGELILVEEKYRLMAKLGEKLLELELFETLTQVPDSLAGFDLEIVNEGLTLRYTFKVSQSGDNAIATLLDALRAEGIAFRDLHTSQSSLEEIFVSLLDQTTVASDSELAS